MNDSPRPLKTVHSGQPTAEELRKLGIKVKDFGLPGNNPLPPVQPYRRRQFQPQKEDDGNSQSQSQSRKPIHRQDTEPMFPIITGLVRGRAFNNLEDSIDVNTSEFFGGYSQPSESLPPLVRPDSQDSEAYPDTPIVTPHGSIQWNVQSAPQSQVENDSQIPEPEPISYSQLGLSQLSELASQADDLPTLTPEHPLRRGIGLSQNGASDPQLRTSAHPSSPLLFPEPRRTLRSPSPLAEPLLPMTEPTMASNRYNFRTRKRPAPPSFSDSQKASKSLKCFTHSPQSHVPTTVRPTTNLKARPKRTRKR